ncbi:putative acyltransferase [Saccharomycopsis crataegensis]|uniref:Acyltransferase n=1 Tax=Saccharomycopsis crataegensis TaxID=43959 RepID=A0AAV5QKI6_9ASCO|nr:putative acyltransferase [Saccharomycopsis crataegensis]
MLSEVSEPSDSVKSSTKCQATETLTKKVKGPGPSSDLTSSHKKTKKQWLIYSLQIIRVVFMVITFLLSAISIVITQLVFKWAFHYQFNIKQGVFALTKKHFVVLITAIMNAVCPSRIRVTGELSSMPKGTFTIINGELHSALIPRSTVIANHQIYTDWAFLWWVAYSANLGDSVYIILKDSLKKIPILGYGMENFKFIFLSRKWEKDQQTLRTSLKRLSFLNTVGTTNDYKNDIDVQQIDGNAGGDKLKWPFCLILFPEGTNMSPSRREVSDKYCAKLGIPKLQNVLLPRATGLRESLKLLKKSCDVVYDVTIGYSGVKKDEYGESNYTLGNVFIRGKAPKITDMYFRAIRLDEVPLGSDDLSEVDEARSLKDFEKWLFDLWYSKDVLMNTYYKYGTFTPDLVVTGESDSKQYNINSKYEVAIAPLKPRSHWEFLQVFAVPASILLIGRLLIKFIVSLI